MVATVPQNLIPKVSNGPKEAFNKSEYSIKRNKSDKSGKSDKTWKRKL